MVNAYPDTYLQPSRTVLAIQDRPAATDAEPGESKVDEVQASIWRGGPWATCMYMPRIMCTCVCICIRRTACVFLCECVYLLSLGMVGFLVFFDIGPFI